MMPREAVEPAREVSSDVAVAEFASTLEERLAPLRKGFERLLEELGLPRTPTQLQKLLGVGYTVCWRLFRVVQTRAGELEVGVVPTRAALRTVLDAAQRQRVSQDICDEIVSAVERYEAFTKLYAASSKTFESIAAGLASGAVSDKVILQRRRAAYEAVSDVWGLQTDLQLCTGIIKRNSDPAKFDIVTLNAQRGIRRLRTDAYVTIGGFGTDQDHLTHEPLDPATAARWGVPVLSQFSTSPFPEIEKVSAQNWTFYNLRSGEIGRRSSIDFTAAIVNRGEPFDIDDAGQSTFSLMFSLIRKPVANAVIELVVHRESFLEVGQVNHLIYLNQDDDRSLQAARQTQQFSTDERVVRLGRADRTCLVGIDNYRDILQFTCERMEWDLSEFDVYRLKVQYPMMCTAMRLFFHPTIPLPDITT